MGQKPHKASKRALLAGFPRRNAIFERNDPVIPCDRPATGARLTGSLRGAPRPPGADGQRGDHRDERQRVVPADNEVVPGLRRRGHAEIIVKPGR